jgi:hypothetical protein
MKVTSVVLAALGVTVSLAALTTTTPAPAVNGDKAVIGYFETLHGFPIDQLDLSKYTHIN